jgi:cytoplasmic iron level regulating protein YaaA (DUF328/UPF0246 family)
MQILLACAKIMKERTSVDVPMQSDARFRREANAMALEMCEMDIDTLMNMLNCSRKIAIETRARYNSFFDDTRSLPAILSYYGQVYKCLKADEFTRDDFLYAQEHLHITSFLYGLLRPLDAICPYRMEGKIELPMNGGMNQFNFWKSRLTDVLIRSVQSDDGVLVHLATEEMQHLFDWKQIKKEVKIIHPQFYVEKGGRLKSVTVYAKSCRGAMARFILRNQLTSPSQLMDFSYEGYAYTTRYGDERHPHFIIEE